MRMVLYFAGLNAIGAWALMFIIGVIHAVWLPMMPTMGYGAALAICLMVDIVALIVAGAVLAWSWLTGV